MNPANGIPLHEAHLTDIELLKPHPENYRYHPEDQVEEFVASIQRFGIYKPIVTAIDHTILVGHGITQACRAMGLAEVPVVRTALDPDSKEAITLMIADNETPGMGERDDRKLTDLLKGIPSLKGTGFDAAKLANLLYITRPKAEIKSFDAAAEWAGMPEYVESDRTIKLILSFNNQEDKNECIRILGLVIKPEAISSWFPPKPWHDISSIRFDVENPDAQEQADAT